MSSQRRHQHLNYAFTLTVLAMPYFPGLASATLIAVVLRVGKATVTADCAGVSQIVPVGIVYTPRHGREGTGKGISAVVTTDTPRSPESRISRARAHGARPGGGNGVTPSGACEPTPR
jgi:hypothetical protein